MSCFLKGQIVIQTHLLRAICGAIQRGLAHAEDRGLDTAGLSLSLSLGSSLLSYIYEACPPFIPSLRFFSPLDCQRILGNLQERHKTKLCVSIYERAPQNKVSRYLYIYMKAKISLGDIDLREADHDPKLLLQWNHLIQSFPEATVQMKTDNNFSLFRRKNTLVCSRSQFHFS